MNKMKKFLVPTLIVAVLSVLVVGQSVLRAQDGSVPVVNNYAEGGIVFGGSSEDVTLGANGTRFPNGISADSTSPIDGEVRGTTQTITGTSTIQETILGSRFSAAFSTTAGATSTVGGLFSIQNTGGPKVCTEIVLAWTTPMSTNAYLVSVSTSTSASSISGVGVDQAPTLVASTSVPILGGRIFSNYSRAGTYAVNNASNAPSSTPWILDNGVYVHGTFNSVVAGATSADYTSQAGRVYMDCYATP